MGRREGKKEEQKRRRELERGTNGKGEGQESRKKEGREEGVIEMKRKRMEKRGS